MAGDRRSGKPHYEIEMPVKGWIKHEKERHARQLIYEARACGHYACLFYLPDDDSFCLDWFLPEGNKGITYLVNPEEVLFSFRYCLRILRQLEPSLMIKGQGSCPNPMDISADGAKNRS